MKGIVPWDWPRVLVGCWVTAVIVPGLAAAHCSTKKVEHKVDWKEVSEVERSQAQGHQPWRSDALAVAQVALVNDDPTLDVNKVSAMKYHTSRETKTKAVFLFSAKDSYRITLRRLRWKEPSTGKTHWTVWWPAETIITHCPQGPPKRTR